MILWGSLFLDAINLNWIKLNDVIILCYHDLKQVIGKDNFKLKLWLCVEKIYLSIVSYLFIMHKRIDDSYVFTIIIKCSDRKKLHIENDFMKWIIDDLFFEWSTFNEAVNF